MNKSFLLALGLSFLFFGCASKNAEVEKEYIIVDAQGKQIRYKPVLGSRGNDNNVTLQMPTVMKIWVAPYINDAGVLITGHDVYAILRDEQFRTGTAVPKARRGYGGTTPTQELPFSLSPYELDRSSMDSDKTIIEFLENGSDLTNADVAETTQKGIRVFDAMEKEAKEKSKKYFDKQKTNQKKNTKSNSSSKSKTTSSKKQNNKK